MVMSLQEVTLRAFLSDPNNADHLNQDSFAYPVIESAARTVLLEIPLDSGVDPVTQFSTTLRRIRQLSRKIPQCAVDWNESLVSIYAKLRFQKFLCALKQEMEEIIRGSIPGEEFAAFFDVNAFRSPDARKRFLREAIDRLDLIQVARERRSSAQILLFLAAQSNYWEVVFDWAGMGGDLNIQDNDGRTALHKAAEYNKPEAIRALLKAGADLDIQDNDGRTALHEAALQKNPEPTRALVKAGAAFDIQDNDGRTALHRAAEFNRSAVIHALAEAGANLNVQDNEGKTALHRAAIFDLPKVIHALAEEGANLNIRDSDDKTALHRALENHCGAAIRALV